MNLWGNISDLNHINLHVPTLPPSKSHIHLTRKNAFSPSPKVLKVLEVQALLKSSPSKSPLRLKATLSYKTLQKRKESYIHTSSIQCWGRVYISILKGMNAGIERRDGATASLKSSKANINSYSSMPIIRSHSDRLG
jgi:hypothetical protein